VDTPASSRLSHQQMFLPVKESSMMTSEAENPTDYVGYSEVIFKLKMILKNVQGLQTGLAINISSNSNPKN
jgi:hypothetical protein